MVTFERDDVQGLVVSGYGTMRAARYLLLRVTDAAAARMWVGDVAGRVTASAGSEAERCTNLAFTHEGLRALGLDADELSTFASPFQEGMTSDHRQRILGDAEASAPDRWEWGGVEPDPVKAAAKQVHVLLLLFAKDDPTMKLVEADETARFSAGGALSLIVGLSPELLADRDAAASDRAEHFGFADSLSQPLVKDTPQAARLGGDDAARSVIETGEFVLGYPNGYGQLTPWPRLAVPGPPGADFGRNGTYLVMRHLAQDVARFWSYLYETTKTADGTADPEAMETLAAKLVGRWRSGAPLVRSEHRDDPDLGSDNSFGYAAVDPYGQRCPLGAHIRRSNPRDSLDSDASSALELANLHRIIRRGRSYGPRLRDPLGGDDGHDRGLFFMCVNANIERQFEFVQHSWCNNPKFAGLYDEQDPLLGATTAAQSFTIQDFPVRRRVHGIPSFVTVRGGAYYFLPGVRALRTLGELRRPA